MGQQHVHMQAKGARVVIVWKPGGGIPGSQPGRVPTLERKVRQLREAGVTLLVGTDSGIPCSFHCQSTWSGWRSG